MLANLWIMSYFIKLRAIGGSLLLMFLCFFFLAHFLLLSRCSLSLYFSFWDFVLFLVCFLFSQAHSSPLAFFPPVPCLLRISSPPRRFLVFWEYLRRNWELIASNGLCPASQIERMKKKTCCITRFAPFYIWKLLIFLKYPFSHSHVSDFRELYALPAMHSNWYICRLVRGQTTNYSRNRPTYFEQKFVFFCVCWKLTLTSSQRWDVDDAMVVHGHLKALFSTMLLSSYIKKNSVSVIEIKWLN